MHVSLVDIRERKISTLGVIELEDGGAFVQFDVHGSNGQSDSMFLDIKIARLIAQQVNDYDAANDHEMSRLHDTEDRITPKAPDGYPVAGVDA